MKAVFSHTQRSLEFFDNDGKQLARFVAQSEVRNELNGKRRLDKAGDVEYTITKSRTVGKPYMPRPYPTGDWVITGKEASTNKWMQPIKFLTDAHRTVKVWEVGPNGYVRETEETTEDYAYHIHFNNGSFHSDGCITGSMDMITWMDKNLTFPCPIRSE